MTVTTLKAFLSFAARLTTRRHQAERATRAPAWASGIVLLLSAAASANEMTFDPDIAKEISDQECACDCCDCCEPAWTLIPWFGITSVDTADTETGFAEGLVAGYRLTDSVGVYGSLGFNHADSNTQVLGTIGLQKFGDPCGCTIVEHMTLWGFLDYYTTADDGPDASQLRFNVGYVFADYVEAGVTFSVSTSDETGGLVPFSPASAMFVGGDFVGGYYNRTFGRLDFFGLLGYSDAIEDVAGSVGLKWAFTQRAKAFVSVTGGDDSVGGIAGMQIGLGRNDTVKH